MAILSNEQVERLYDKNAGIYDRLVSGFRWAGLGRWRRDLVDRLELKAGDHVVDLCAGTGANLAFLLESVGPSGKVTLVDLSQGMLDQARRRAKRLRASNVEFVQSDVAAFRFPSETRAVISTFGLEMPPDYAGLIERASAALPTGGRMALLIDPACEIENFGQTLALGRACDEANFFWLEDPYQDGGVSQFAHRKLRQMVKTPMLQTEHIRLLEQHVDFIVADGTDYVRAGAHEDGGVTGALKIAHASEGFGLDVELHGPGPVHRHIMSSIRNTNFFELGLVHPKVKTTKPPVYLGYNDDLDGIDSEGNVYAPDGPGIGVPLDWDWIRAHQVDEGVLAEA